MNIVMVSSLQVARVKESIVELKAITTQESNTILAVILTKETCLMISA